MTFTVRSFTQCVEELRAMQPGKKLREQTPTQYDSKQAFAFEDLAAAKKPPITSLYLQEDPFLHSRTVLSDPNSLLDYLSLGPAVGTWNASGQARWQHQGDQWIIADVDIGRGESGDDFEDDTVSAIFALWKVDEGYAAALFRPDERAALAKVMGLDAWPADGWQQARVRYGE